MAQMGPGTMMVKVAGKRGGEATLRRHGKAFYRRIGRIGARTRHGKRRRR